MMRYVWNIDGIWLIPSGDITLGWTIPERNGALVNIRWEHHRIQWENLIQPRFDLIQPILFPQRMQAGQVT